MPHIPVNLNDAVESKPVKPARYNLTITQVDETVTKEKGTPQLLVNIAVDGHDDAPTIRHYMSLPTNGDEPKSASFKILLIRRFCSLFSLPYDDSGFDTDAWPGATANMAEVTLSEPDANGNIYNRLNVPRLREEATTNAGGRSTPKPPKS